ncbi:hypothetical protein C5C27_17570, partial [Rathayibacter sp. AY2B7]
MAGLLAGLGGVDGVGDPYLRRALGDGGDERRHAGEPLVVGAAGGDDAINGFPITAGGRLLEVGLLTLGIVVGIAVVL